MALNNRWHSLYFISFQFISFIRDGRVWPAGRARAPAPSRPAPPHPAPPRPVNIFFCTMPMYRRTPNPIREFHKSRLLPCTRLQDNVIRNQLIPIERLGGSQLSCDDDWLIQPVPPLTSLPMDLLILAHCEL